MGYGASGMGSPQSSMQNRGSPAWAGIDPDDFMEAVKTRQVPSLSRRSSRIRKGGEMAAQRPQINVPDKGGALSARIDRLVSLGEADSKAGFVRQAVREKLDRMEKKQASS